MDIERLRALENKWRDEFMGGDDRELKEIGYDACLLDCADELASLIAELGQEVGAVEPVAFAVELPDGSIGKLGWMDYASFDLCTGVSELLEGCRYVYAYRTSPAHTSEARDAVTEEAIVALVAGPYMYHHKMDDHAVREGKAFDRCRELTIQNIRTHFAMLAAMRQEAGNK